MPATVVGATIAAGSCDRTMPASCGRAAPVAGTTDSATVGHTSNGDVLGRPPVGAGARHPAPTMLRDPQRPFAPPPDATELLLVRHGSAGGPASGEPPDLVGGHTDVPLAALGHVQARA